MAENIDSADVVAALENADDRERQRIINALGMGTSRREFMKAAGGLGAGALIGGGAAHSITGSAKADPSTGDGDGNIGLPNDRVDVFADGIDAVDLRGIADRIIRSSDDAQSIIEAGSAGDVFWLEPGGSWDLTSTFTPPKDVALLSNGGRVGSPSVTFTKKFSGGMMQVPSGLYMRSIRFDGNKANYTGDGLVDASNGVNGNYWQWVHVVSNAGDNRVTDGHYFSTFDGCRFSSANGWGIRHTSSGTAEISQNTYTNRTQIAKNGSGAIKYESFAHEEDYRDVVIASNNGDVLYAIAGLDNLHLGGNIQDNDGVILFDEAADGSSTAVKSASIDAEVNGNAAALSNSNVNNSGTRDVGSVHLQRTVAVDNLELSGKWSGGNEVVPFSCYSDFRADASIDIWRTDAGSYTNDARVNTNVRKVDIHTSIINGTILNSGAPVMHYGDGEIHDLNQSARLYFDAGEVKVEDSAGNITTIS